MAVKKEDLEIMDRMVSNGKTISQIWKRFNSYDYWEIYWAVKSSSLLGTKRMITNALNKIVNESSKKNRQLLKSGIIGHINEIYETAKKNGAKLATIEKTIIR